jgi:hypothetical protein
MDLGGLAESVLTMLAIAFFIALILSFVGAMFVARQCKSVMRRSAAVCCGTFVGVVAAAVFGWLVLLYANSLAWLLLCPFLGALVGNEVTWIIVFLLQLSNRINPDQNLQHLTADVMWRRQGQAVLSVTGLRKTTRPGTQ